MSYESIFVLQQIVSASEDSLIQLMTYDYQEFITISIELIIWSRTSLK